MRERNFVSNVFLKDKLNYKNNRETGDILHPDKEIYTQRELLNTFDLISFIQK